MAGDIPALEDDEATEETADDNVGDGGNGDEATKEKDGQTSAQSSGKASPVKEPPSKPADKPRAAQQPTVVKKPTAEDELAARFAKLKKLG